MNRFIDEQVEVTLSGEFHEPAGFTWRGRHYDVQKILQRWSDWNFGAGSFKRSWRNRRHRNYYRVQTPDGLFELYLDRGAPDLHHWILYQELSLDEPEHGQP